MQMRRHARMSRAILTLGLSLLAFPSWAQVAKTVTNSSAQLVPAQTRGMLSVCNQSSTDTISYCFADTTGSCTAALNTAGQFTVSPLNCSTWHPGEGVPHTAIYAITGGTSTPVTVVEK